MYGGLRRASGWSCLLWIIRESFVGVALRVRSSLRRALASAPILPPLCATSLEVCTVVQHQRHFTARYLVLMFDSFRLRLLCPQRSTRYYLLHRNERFIFRLPPKNGEGPTTHFELVELVVTWFTRLKTREGCEEVNRLATTSRSGSGYTPKSLSFQSSRQTHWGFGDGP